MKKFFVKTVFLILISLNATAQNQGYFEFGKRFGGLECANLNRSVYTYNYTRQWLDQKMAYFGNNGKGIDVSYGQQPGLVGWEMGFNNFHESHDAHGVEPSGGLTAYRRITYWNFGLYVAIPIKIISNRFIDINFVPSLDASYHEIHLQYANSPDISNAEIVKATSEPKLGYTFALAMKLYPLRWLGVDVKPFVSWSFHKTDVSGVQYELQGANYPYGLLDSFKSYGVNFLISLAKRDDF